MCVCVRATVILDNKVYKFTIRTLKLYANIHESWYAFYDGYFRRNYMTDPFKTLWHVITIYK
jgi:hypothetical protein